MNRLFYILKLISQLSPKSIVISIMITLLKTLRSLLGVLIPAIIINVIEQELGITVVFVIIIGYCGITFFTDITEKPLSLLATAYEYTMNNLCTLKIGQKGMKVDYKNWELSEEIDKNHKAVVGSWEFMGLGSVVFEKLLGAFISFLTMAYIISKVNFAVLIVILILMFINMNLEKKNGKVQHKIDEKIAESMKKAKYDIELLHNLELGKEIRLYNAENFICNKFRQSSLELLAGKKEKLKANLKTKLMMNFLVFLQSLIVYFMSVWKYSTKSISIGYFVVFYNSIMALADSVGTIFSAIADIQNALVYYDDYKAYMEKEDISNKASTIHINPEQEIEIVFNNVSFKYPTNEDYTLHNISMVIHPKTKVAFVGENGSGKTTLIKLLMRLYDATEGEILLNGINILEYDFDEYTKLMAPVFQDFVLHAYSIRDNISFGKCSQDEIVWDLIDQVGIKKTVEKTPEGLDTFVTKQISDNGIDFSGGEKQKIAIARAFYKNAQFNILDEPTSALDPLAERTIFCLFDEFVKDRTGIYISHRMPSIKMADEIFVLNKGSIVEHGTINDLLKSKGIFAEFYEMQSSFYK